MSLLRTVGFLVSFLALVACGGGGDGAPANSSPTTPPTTPPAANVAAIANAGATQSVVVGALVTLDGSASTDANGDPLSYAWTLTSRPAGSGAALAGATSAKPTFTADLAGTYVASLVVNDGKVNSAPSTVAVTAAEPKRIGVAYVARNGMTVTLTAFSVTDLGNGYTRYSATYRQENNTAVAIDEATLRLYFTNADPAPQFGFFNTVLPGPAFAVTRSYFFDVLNSATPWLLQYDADHFFAAQPVPGALQWNFPIR